jgi:uncharacterized protein with LGFP repeats
MAITQPFHPGPPIKPGPAGPPDIGSKNPPPPPADFTASAFPPVLHDEAVQQAVLGITMTEDANLTASVTSAGSVFRIVNLAVNNQALVQLTAADLPPALQNEAGNWVWEDTPVAIGDGITPIAVKKGQRVYLNVSCDVPVGTVPPGALSGTVVLKADTASLSTAAVTGTYLGVNPNSQIGFKWAAMGGEPFFGAAKTNELTSPDGRGIVQEFANGTLYEFFLRTEIDLKAPRVYYFSPPIWAKWLSLQDVKDASSTPLWQVLVFPAGDSVETAEHGQAMPFEAGHIVARPGGATWVVSGAIYARYKLFGDPDTSDVSPMGYPNSDEVTLAGGWRAAHFDTGDIYWSSATGAHEMHGVIRTHWLANQILGYPITDQTLAADGAGLFNHFQNGAIYQVTSTAPPFEVHGPIYTRWAAIGLETSYLGFPVSDVIATEQPVFGARAVSTFQYGQLLWSAASGSVGEEPATVQQSQQILTPTGTALGGTVSMVLKSNGDYSVQFHMHDSGIPGYDFDVSAIFTTPGGLVIAASHSGHVEGTDSTTLSHAPNRDDDNTVTGNNPAIRMHWADVGKGTLWATKDYSATGIIGFAEDVVKLVIDVTSTVAGIGIGVVIGLGTAFGQVFSRLGIGGVVGAIAGVAVMAFDGGWVVALVAGVGAGLVTNALIQSEHLHADEYAFCLPVFGGSLPAAVNIIRTNLSGFSGRAFTLPGIDGNIYINLGDGYSNPTTYTNPAYPAKGQLLIHEMTHAWQIRWQSFTPGLICSGVVNGIDNQFGQSVYQYGEPGPAWGNFGLEAQGAIVDQWFGGTKVVNAPNRQPEDPKDPYFTYIANNIRVGRT